MIITSKSYAKINIFLNVLNKRDDGFHNIETLFSKIDLYDLLVAQRADEFSITVNDESIPTGESNIIYKVYNTLQKKLNINLPGVKVKLIKNIPSGAGLGGGSSNAATFLNILDELFSLNLTLDLKLSILSQVGSDTCFFLYDKPMIGKGRGEILDDAPGLPFMYILLVKPNIFVSTAEIYQNLKLKLTSNKEVFRMRHILSLQDVLKIMNNDLENVAMSRYRLLQTVKEEIINSGALKAMLSGSGATVFGIFNSSSLLDKAYNYFRNRYPDYFIYRTNNI
ncbi:MAG: 4-diphosphocytidyl-2-C-methyl-D-erythritolkinase [Deferribacteraceae bacterium]|jgi:4-diphosphocytidyl-2-C-methyl-D-erythritol kinase|nr:4-diphosphocytidyl-2-C-methyl-D-erythritolkinase [Deferribacteraceae bacterium]